MKKQIILAITLLIFTLTPAFSQIWQAKPQISVSGSAEVKVVPDEIYLNVGIETRDKDLQAAKKQNDDHVSGALDFLKHNGVKEKDVKTDYISIQPVYLRENETYNDPNTGLSVANRDNGVLSTKPLYYIVRKSIGIKLTNIESFDGVLSGLITNGVNVVQGIDFRTSDLRKYRDKARAMAIQAAKEKAEAMASELGVKLGKADSVNENDFGGWSSLSRNSWGQGGGGGGGMYQNASQNGGGGTGSDEGALSVGQISVSANVNVTFLIE
jgi:uncharacterized protein YggE